MKRLTHVQPQDDLWHTKQGFSLSNSLPLCGQKLHKPCHFLIPLIHYTKQWSSWDILQIFTLLICSSYLAELTGWRATVVDSVAFETEQRLSCGLLLSVFVLVAVGVAVSDGQAGGRGGLLECRAG